jgi:hypothetical protein
MRPGIHLPVTTVFVRWWWQSLIPSPAPICSTARPSGARAHAARTEKPRIERGFQMRIPNRRATVNQNGHWALAHALSSDPLARAIVAERFRKGPPAPR